MMQATVVWGDPSWRWIAAIVLCALLLVLAREYWRIKVAVWVRVVAGGVKAIGILILALCLLEPLFSSTRARPGANLFIVLGDNSQSMTLRDRDAVQTRAEQFKSITTKDAKWLTRIGQDFDLRQYAFDTQLHTGADFQAMSFTGGASNLGATLQRLARQYHGRPLAGIIVLTDGSATDADVVERALMTTNDTEKLPPIYPVPMGRETPADDVNLQQVTVSQTNFEDAPVTLAAQITTSGYRGQMLVAQLFDESGKPVDQQKVRVEQDGEPVTARFRVRPEKAGVSFYRVRVGAENQVAEFDGGKTTEATLANNSRLVVVDRGKGPYRVLYVTGRPNWEYKFLQRAVQSDDQVQLVGLIRVAKREPKFNYINAGNRSNPLFRGFDNTDTEQVEQYDQPVLVRIGTEDQNELRKGFPQTAEELYRYHAIIIGDLEAEFFTQSQMQLIKNFVRQRGGGLLMLGGQESLREGHYDRTPVGDLLPVYLDGSSLPTADAQYHLSLTREGWLEPWVRLRSDEDAERQRLATVPPFQTINSVRGIKPGATILANAEADVSGAIVPALVEQRFGRGRALALMIGDLWRWGLHRATDAEDDMSKSWRQTVRWLVSEVPQRVEMAVAPRYESDDPDGMLSLSVRVRDPAYAALDNAAVVIHVSGPDGHTVDLPAEASARDAGLYEAVYVPRQSGAYRASAKASGSDGAEIATVLTGWTSDPSADEFRDLKVNRALLDHIAQKSGGQVVLPDDLDRFADGLPMRHAEVTEEFVRPIWHQPWVFLLAIACLAGEWGLRRWKGLP